MSLANSVNTGDKIGNSAFRSKIEYQHAAQFSALKWHSSINSPTKILLKPLKNDSGIRSNAQQDKPEYYEHGKLPQTINLLVKDLVLSTRVLDVVQEESVVQEKHDVEMQLLLNHYSHPFDYAPDDHWYKTLQDQVDRWAITKKHAKVSLTLKMTSKSSRFKPWMSSVESTLSNCDLNSIKYPLMPFNHTDESLSAYVESTMGQAFISASNYLLLQATEHLNTQQKRARVVSNSYNELLLSATQGNFVIGENYQLVFNNQYSSPRHQPGGSVQVVKSMGNQAIAYPRDLRPDHIKVGDWVEIGKPQPIARPISHFLAKNNCASVGTATIETAEASEVSNQQYTIDNSLKDDDAG